MAEGERVWYWRNRQENERWFWETMFFDRIVARGWQPGSHVLLPCPV